MDEELEERNPSLEAVASAKELLDQSAPLSKVIAAVLDAELGQTPQERQALKKIAWDFQATEFAGWIADLVRKTPLPSNARGLMFMVPEIELNDPVTNFSAFNEWAPASMEELIPGECVWPPDSDAADDEGTGDFQVEAMLQAQTILGIGPGSSEETESLDRLTGMAYALPQVALAVLIREALPRVPRELLLQGRTRLGVAVMFWGGDWLVIGDFTTEGWVDATP